jgi:hypothetical protein
MQKTPYRITAACLAIVFYSIHAGALIYSKQAHHIVWSCHLGCLLVGVGLLALHPWLSSVGFLWLALGVPLWILNVFTRNEFMLTSTFSHLGGLAIAIYGFKYLKMPRLAWAAATAGLVLLGWFSRLVTPEHANVNLSFSVWKGWEETFPSYFWYAILLLAAAVASFLILEFFVRRWQ